jgi:hypothetical protein
MSISQGKSNNGPQNDFYPKTRSFNPLMIFSKQGFCFIIFVLFILMIAYGVIFFVRTGLFSVPILSNIFYKEPIPSEIVMPTTELNIIDKFSNISTSGVDIVITQEELTYLINNTKKFDKSQISISDINMQLYCDYYINGKKIILTLNYLPIVRNNQLDYKILSFYIGSQKMPNFSAYLIKEFIIKSFTNNFIQNSGLTINRAELKKGEMVISALKK